MNSTRCITLTVHRHCSCWTAVCFKPLSFFYSMNSTATSSSLKACTRCQKPTFSEYLACPGIHVRRGGHIKSLHNHGSDYPDVILDRFRHTIPDDVVSIFSASTAHSGHEWLKTCSTLRTELKDSRSIGAQKLGQTIHHLSSQAKLLHNELEASRKKVYLEQNRQRQLQRQSNL
ncbi:hypothetical protein IQ06DRAFT_110196 [Phaeosphaeriaceae sp. SRC1lsM3a]|nr:hypothetical protein IQ06DRAFT_110196 [Stagonospora sp. SRC1lsM3a]